jgi:hypothetical protein
MFDPPRKLKHITKHFQTLCDAAMALDAQPMIGNIPDDILECAHLIMLTETAVIRECTNAAEEISTADPIELNYLVSALHKKISNYLFICSLLLDTDRLDSNSSD